MKLTIHCAVINAASLQFLSRLNLTALHKELGKAYKLWVQDNMEHEREPNGAPWRDLSPLTAERKVTKTRKRGYHPILRVTGRLADSITYQADDSHVTVGTNVEYAPIHQFGGAITPKRGKALSFGGRFFRKVTIPARPYLFGRDGSVPEDFRQRLVKIVDQEVAKCLS